MKNPSKTYSQRIDNFLSILVLAVFLGFVGYAAIAAFIAPLSA
ncbi:MAG: hypothetical protein ABSF50_05675 [Burkholderiaceae bacterium]|jgi:hypothetical protein